jgi:rod shape determining protein RodA
MSAHTIFFLKKHSPITIFLVISLLNIAPALLILKQPDLGSAILLLSAGMFPLLLAQIPTRFFLIIAGLICCALPLSWQHLHSYQKERVLTLLNPDRDPLGQGYHVQQSKIAIGSGGLFGKGFCFNTQADYDFLPEHDTDFAFALFAEEWGFIGCFLVILLFLLLKVHVFSLVLKTKSHYSQLIMFALVAPMFLFVVINISMVTGLLPVVGVPLPFFSRGGTHLLTTMFSLGLFFSLYIKDKSNYRGRVQTRN